MAELSKKLCRECRLAYPVLPRRLCDQCWSHNLAESKRRSRLARLAEEKFSGSVYPYDHDNQHRSEEVQMAIDLNVEKYRRRFEAGEPIFDADRGGMTCERCG